ncbi:YjiH family protein [Corynebacterium coyleae]|uniref:YjiH family protein n=1 Tax=Corynebacterium coyleae TaxID=53374 RepID=UPI00254A2374|nr:YjiH family protein [Corynebacterium coyleae]MDK8664081.1 YjiH family protein [Corynebacterium coyleae]MDK8707177.1 YjiH family protein [Corynebacterium coyleae]MDK8733981.1 YjiH family protein [Corynebacterium coyleae]MDK8893221.1 YjiH family protein [Corynebacterium coyleae]
MEPAGKRTNRMRRYSPAWPVKDLPASSHVLVDDSTQPADPDPDFTPDADVKPQAVWRFFVYSAIGIVAFFVPFSINGSKSTILLDHIVTWITTTLGEGTRFLALAAIIAGTIYQFVTGRWKEDYARMAFAALSVLAIVLCAMLTFGFGPEWLFNPDIGPFILDKLVISVGLLIPVGAIFLGLLVGFGLMEFIGVMVQPIMRPVFHTPGKSAVDAVASFLGSYSLGLLITDRMYKNGSYNGREASIVAAGFSTVSATFMVIVAKTLDIMEHWIAYFFIAFIITFIVTAITVRIPPISRIPEDYYPGATPHPEKEITGNRFKAAWREAKIELNRADSLGKVLWTNFRDGLVMAVQVTPGIMSVGVIGLVLATYTPVFKAMGVVFYPVAWLLRLPDPWATSGALATGLAEMFLPATLTAGSDDMVLKFTIAVVCVSQIFFFSAMVPAVLATDIPLNIVKMVIIWFIRVVLTVIITVPVAHLLF